jgi:hypothetical protein
MYSLPSCLGRFGALPMAVIQTSFRKAGAFAVGLVLFASGSTTLAGQTTWETTLGSSAVVETDNSSNSHVLSFAHAGGDSAEEQIFQGDLVSARSVTDFARNAQPFGVMSNHFNVFSGLAALRPLSLSGQGLAETIADLHDRRPSHSASLKPVPADASASGQTRLVPSDFAFDETAAAMTAAAMPTQGNVLIPIPSAALSGLSVMGALGVFAGIRRAIRVIR